jgi:hypothetical protein
MTFCCAAILVKHAGTGSHLRKRHHALLFSAFQDWALGVLHTKIICAMAMMGPEWWLKRVLDQVSRLEYCQRFFGIFTTRKHSMHE